MQKVVEIVVECKYEIILKLICGHEAHIRYNREDVDGIKKDDVGKGSDLLHEDRYGDRWRNSWR